MSARAAHDAFFSNWDSALSPAKRWERCSSKERDSFGRAAAVSELAAYKKARAALVHAWGGKEETWWASELDALIDDATKRAGADAVAAATRVEGGR